MTNPTTSTPVRKSNIKLIFGIAGWAIIYTALVLGAGFHFGDTYRASQEASKKAAVSDALKAAATPAAVAQAPSKN